ncbi:MAG: helix-turn-helix transcriptional regulator [Alphaproteobacteria bacterium]|nr:helix-turn-helix transcriptional regulator [Alphaproteobacteria bacterium]
MKREQPLSSHQVKAARALLDWSQDVLAEATKLSAATIRKIELGTISPRQGTMSVIRATFEEAGIEFIDSDGVRRRSEEVMTYFGGAGRKDFYEDMFDYAKRTGCEIAIIDSTTASLIRTQEGEVFLKKLIDETLSTIKCIVVDDIDVPIETLQFECRRISKQYIDPAPQCVYGDWFALIVGETYNNHKIIAMHSKSAAVSIQRQFMSIWDKATPLSKETKKFRRA